MTTQKIHYETYGDGPLEIVICNGLSQSTANWRGIARQNPGYRWILFDARGHGKSPVGARPYVLDDHVDDLLHVLEQTGAQKPVLMGFSHGGRVAIRAAAEHGHRFLGLVVVSTASKVTVRRNAYIESWHNCLKLGGVKAMAWASLPNIVGRKILMKFPDLDFLVRGSMARNNEEGLLAVFEGMKGYPPAVDDAVRIQLPTLILRGDEDPLVSEQDVRELCTWISGAREVLFKACGHTLPLEEPEQFIDALKEPFAAWSRL